MGLRFVKTIDDKGTSLNICDDLTWKMVCKKAIRRGDVVVIKGIAYEREKEVDKIYEEPTGKIIKRRFPNYGTKKQTVETIKKFPWEE